MTTPSTVGAETETATGIAHAIATGLLSPTEVAQRTIARIERLDPDLGAMSDFDAERLLEDAAQLTKEAGARSRRGPLHGVPVGIKAWFDIEGYRAFLQQERSDTDATLVRRLRSAGALIVGKTAVPIGETPPATRNPWNLDHTPGGSSSGSGAGVAARYFPLSLGEQTGGSNLRPAAYCGVAAIKPSYGLLSRDGMMSMMWSRDHPGLMGLSAADMMLALPVLAGPDRNDPITASAAALPEYIAGLDRPPSIGHVRNHFPERAGTEANAALERAARSLRDAGAQVQDFLLPDGFDVVWHAVAITAAEWVADRAARWAAEGSEVRLEHLGTGSAAKNTSMRRSMELVPAPFYIHVRRIRQYISESLRALMSAQGLDSILMPVTPGPAPAGFETTGDPELLVPWSFLGLPAATVNVGINDAGLPLGAQLVAPRGEDVRLLQVADAVERILGTLPAPPLVQDSTKG